jgi:hypothetical protein
MRVCIVQDGIGRSNGLQMLKTALRQQGHVIISKTLYELEIDAKVHYSTDSFTVIDEVEPIAKGSRLLLALINKL